MTPSMMQPHTRQELHALSPATKAELRNWLANKIQICAGARYVDRAALREIMDEFDALMSDGRSRLSHVEEIIEGAVREGKTSLHHQTGGNTNG